MRIFDDLNRHFSDFNGFTSKIERAGRAPTLSIHCSLFSKNVVPEAKKCVPDPQKA